MRLKLAENIPTNLASDLAAAGHDADTVAAEGLQGADDLTIWNAAQSGGRFLVIQDLDFSDVRVFGPATHAGILLVRLRDPSRRRVAERVRALFATEDVEAWSGALVVATDAKVRVRSREAPAS
jgi:predicted nuclease of predicted toxin-antitoxin system